MPTELLARYYLAFLAFYQHLIIFHLSHHSILSHFFYGGSPEPASPFDIYNFWPYFIRFYFYPLPFGSYIAVLQTV
jgi:hypothetical protein